VDDDESVNEKKSSRSKKSATHFQQTIERGDSTIDDLLTAPSATNTEIQELPTPHNLDRFTPHITV
jgi:hypothetical protein